MSNPGPDSEVMRSESPLWNPEREAVYIETLAEQSRDRKHGSYSTSAWIAVADAINARCKPAQTLTGTMMIHKYLELQNRCMIYRDLVKANYFFWDEKSKVISADEEVWNDYFRTGPLVYLESLVANAMEFDLVG
ncbi:hypothetical protein GP486_007055 [Trichoglossum hirsutum]|uniref:Myb/SANT-like domain-containing protein n=1 Tax=Trichoglossum hirsutum TaxID=265104 RepID=A0A9P8L7P3_9PEZI|nr:hypothetical protein GP486_007055 [Trichoglossum hirsutum]